MQYGWLEKPEDYYFESIEKTIEDCLNQAEEYEINGSITIYELLGEYYPQPDAYEILERQLEQDEQLTDLDNIPKRLIKELDKKLYKTIRQWQKENFIHLGYEIGKTYTYDVKTRKKIK